MEVTQGKATLAENGWLLVLLWLWLLLVVVVVVLVVVVVGVVVVVVVVVSVAGSRSTLNIPVLLRRGQDLRSTFTKKYCESCKNLRD